MRARCGAIIVHPAKYPTRDRHDVNSQSLGRINEPGNFRRIGITAESAGNAGRVSFVVSEFTSAISACSAVKERALACLKVEMRRKVRDLNKEINRMKKTIKSILSSCLSAELLHRATEVRKEESDGENRDYPGREILDSRGNPTVEVECALSDGSIGPRGCPLRGLHGRIRGRGAA